MKLKDIMAAEAASVFCNPDEFGESVNLDGHHVTAVMGEVSTVYSHDVEPDVPMLTRVMSVPQSSLPDGYEPEGTADYNDEQWAVGEYFCAGGMFSISLWRRA